MPIPTNSGPFLPIHVGLLDDERFDDMSAGQRGIWVTLYLLLDREPEAGWFRDRARVEWLLRRHGIAQPAEDVSALIESGWLVAENDDSPKLTIRKWSHYTDAKSRKAVYNRSRDRSRGDSLSPQETAGDLEKTRKDETRTFARKRARGVPASVQELRDAIAEKEKRTS
jgi:hypothetical protein